MIEQCFTVTFRQQISMAEGGLSIREGGAMVAQPKERIEGPRLLRFPGMEVIPAAPQPQPSLLSSQTPRQFWEQHVATDRRLSKSTLSENLTSLSHFERLVGDAFPLARVDSDLLDQLAGGRLAPSARRKLFVLLRKLLRLAVRRKLLAGLPEFPPLDSPPRRGAGLAVSLADFEKMFANAAAATWPVRGFDGLTPTFIWETWLLLFWCYGARTQDFVAYKSADFAGLLWESVRFEPACPIHFDLRWPHGWLDFTPRKTKRKSAARVVVPIHPLLRPRLQRFRGCDLERVFPNGRNKRQFAASWLRIREAAGVTADVTIAAASRPSIRRSCNQNWNSLFPGLGGYVLGHRPADVNAGHYENFARRAVEHIGELVMPAGE